MCFIRLVSAFVNKIVHATPTSRRYAPVAALVNGSFDKFVDHVIGELTHLTPEDMDPHWRPMSDRCGYCDVDYMYIGKMETFDEDWRYLAKRTGVQAIVKTSLHKNVENVDPDREMKGYLSMLSDIQQKKLQRLYERDLILFDYNWY